MKTVFLYDIHTYPVDENGDVLSHLFYDIDYDLGQNGREELFSIGVFCPGTGKADYFDLMKNWEVVMLAGHKSPHAIEM